jgi:predicted nucleic acid-binding protein
VKGWLLDTNVLSAVGPGRRPVPREIVTWIHARTDALHLSTISAAEIEAGIAKLGRTGAIRRAHHLRKWFDRILDDYADRVLPFDLAAARIAGGLDDAARAVGRHPGFADVAIAAIAKAHELVVVTLNQRHFEPLEVEVFNPFAPD